jgi:hypothetical protein
MSTKRREKLTIEVEPELREALARWATEDGRAIGNLGRRLLTMAVADHEQRKSAA